MSDLEDLKKISILIDSMKTLIGDNVFDKKLINKKTEDIYDYIIEKTYETPEYIEDVSFNSPEKIKIAFNKFYYEKLN
jgi:tyrosyl-tRNA synthetase